MVFCAFAVLAAAIFIRLGFWQLERLHEKRARNAVIARQQRADTILATALPGDTGRVHYRSASATGRYDYSHELVLSGRTHQGSPGVELLTPLRLAGRDTAVLVNRGWVYSPDAGTVDLARWREKDSATVTGYWELFAPEMPVLARAPRDARTVRRMTRGEIEAKLPYPVAAYYLVATSVKDSAGPARRDIPVLDDGPHMSYAMQWFFFAAISLGGAAVVALRERRERAAWQRYSLPH